MQNTNFKDIGELVANVGRLFFSQYSGQFYSQNKNFDFDKHINEFIEKISYKQKDKIIKLTETSISQIKEVKKMITDYWYENIDIYKCYCRDIYQQRSWDLFRECGNRLLCRLSNDDRIRLELWLANSIRRIKGLRVLYPMFLGLYGEMGCGKDTFIMAIQRAMGCRETTYNMSDIINGEYSTKEFFQSGIVRFEECDTRTAYDISKLKSLITETKHYLNEKYKPQIEIETRNVYCCTANESLDFLCNENENRRILNIEWKSIKDLFEVEGTFNNLFNAVFDWVNSCPYDDERFLQENLYTDYLRNQDSILDFTENKFIEFKTKKRVDDRDCGYILDYLLSLNKQISTAEISNISGISKFEARKFLNNKKYFEKTKYKNGYVLYKPKCDEIKQFVYSETIAPTTENEYEKKITRIFAEDKKVDYACDIPKIENKQEQNVKCKSVEEFNRKKRKPITDYLEKAENGSNVLLIYDNRDKIPVEKDVYEKCDRLYLTIRIGVEIMNGQHKEFLSQYSNGVIWVLADDGGMIDWVKDNKGVNDEIIEY